jgi:pre-60S factor REI1
VCSKKFSSERALANHISSRRHRDAARSRAPHMSPEAAAIGPITPASPGAMLSPADSDIEAEEEDALFEEEMDMEKRIAETVPFGMNECVFDGLVSDYPLANVKHMQTFGFFLPFAESLTDLNGLLEYLGQKVGIGYACVECDRSFTSVAAVQRHMVDKQHCRMTSDEDVWFEEYAPFYAFEEEGDGRSDGWEEVNEEEAAAAEAAMKGKEETGLQVATADASSSVGRPREYDETQEEEVAMILGNKVIGHRSFQRYYRQRLNAVDHREAVVINRLASELRVLGWQDKKMADPVFRTKRMNAFRHSKRNLEVGMKNYYTRKAPLRVSFSALNSGYVRILSWLFVAF